MADYLSAGRQIDGYEIRGLLRRGRGIAGYEARVVGSGGAVIVNEYLPDRLAVRSGDLELSPRTSGEQSAFDAGLARFLALYQVLARISHPAVVAVDRVFRANGTGYAVMDYTQGETLSAMLADGATLSPQALSGILFPLVDGLEAVHRANLLHREISPDNILVRPDGSPVLTGFGVAPATAGGPRQAFGDKAAHAESRPITGYAALEQYSHRRREGPWTDIYALGAVAYRCVTGLTPEDAPGRVLHDDMVPTAQAAKGRQDSVLFAGIDAALALRVEERPQSVAAWREEMRPSARTAAVSARPRGRMAARRATRVVGETATDTNGPNWMVPAVAAIALVAVLTWVDTGVLRSSGDGPVAAIERVASPEADGGIGTPGVSHTREVLNAADDRTRGKPPPSSERNRGAGVTATSVGLAEDAEFPAGAGPDAQAEGRLAGTPPASADPAVALTREIAEVVQSASATRETGADSGGAAPERPSDRGRLQPAVARSRTGDARTPDPTPGLEAGPVGDAEGLHLAGVFGNELESGDGAGGVGPGVDDPANSQEPDVPRPLSDEAAGAVEPQPFKVASQPAGATISFADGDGPYAPGMLLSPGDYRVSVALPGYETWEGTVVHGTAPTDRLVMLAEEETEFIDALESGGVGPLMVKVPPGTYRMGCVSETRCFRNELPVLDVEIKTQFAVSKFEVTFDDYDRFTDATGYRRAETRSGWARGGHPVINVNRMDAMAYADWLSSETGRPYRLPTEAEWEYAARASSAQAYYWGNETGAGRANCGGCMEYRRWRGTMPVGSFAANAWGLHDLHGNVWEWVANCSDADRGVVGADTEQPMSDACRRAVRRGGSWTNSPRRIRSASRNIIAATLRASNTGFRVLLDMQ